VLIVVLGVLIVVMFGVNSSNFCKNVGIWC
jgi:hypothetical protein